MGNFGSKGGLRRFIPSDQGDSTDRVDLANIFRRTELDAESQQIQHSPQEKPLQEIVDQSLPGEMEKEVPDRSGEGLCDPAD